MTDPASQSAPLKSLDTNPDQILVTHHLVAWMDVLDQKALLRKLPMFFATTEEGARVHELLRQTAGVVLMLRDLTNRYFIASQGSSPLRQSLSDADRTRLESITQRRVSVRSVSDTVVLTASLADTDNHCTAVNGVHHAFHALCSVFLLMLAGLHPVRAGVDVGLNAEIERGEPGEVYGAALVHAYDLESAAGYPRVAIGQTLVEYLEAISSIPGAQDTARSARLVAHRCREMIIRDNDGFWILDYLGKSFRESVDIGKMREDVILPSYRFVIAEGERFRSAGDAKLAQRYGLLRDYLESRIPAWGVPPLITPKTI